MLRAVRILVPVLAVFALVSAAWAQGLDPIPPMKPIPPVKPIPHVKPIPPMTDPMAGEGGPGGSPSQGDGSTPPPQSASSHGAKRNQIKQPNSCGSTDSCVPPPGGSCECHCEGSHSVCTIDYGPNGPPRQ